MGQVLRALDLLTGKLVALKRLSQRASVPSPSQQTLSSGGEASNASVARSKPQALAREFHLLASLCHPNIIRVFDYGIDSLCQPYFTMELLENAQPLLPFALHAPRSVQIDLLVQILRALYYLHRHGILHRDLKPSNILVHHEVPGPLVTLLDFGLAIDRDEAQREPAAGTLLYMAPELLLGAPASEASDVYAIGVLAYQMLTGRHLYKPHEPEDELAPHLGQLITQALSDEEPELALLPPSLQPVIGSTLSKTPAKRPDAATLLQELAAQAK